MGGTQMVTMLSALLATASVPTPFEFDIPVATDHRVSTLDAGIPAEGPAGQLCLRSGTALIRLGRSRAAETLDFSALARTAIRRDVQPDWDGHWDHSLMVDTKIVFDAQGRAYTLVIPRLSNLTQAVLLWSRDACKSWQAIRLVSRNAAIEGRGVFTDRALPPTILSHEMFGAQQGRRLWLELFRWDGAQLVRRAPPLLAAEDSLYTANHSGGGNATFTGGGRVVLVYPKADEKRQGTLAVARELDLVTLSWTGGPVPIARSTTKLGGDNHDLPAITRLPSGGLIVVIGAHHARLQVVESCDTSGSVRCWKTPITLGDPEKGRAYSEYTYSSLNVSRLGVVNIIARAEGRIGHYDLVQFRRSAQGSWTEWLGGLPHRPVVVIHRPAYGAWRQQVSESPSGRLYLHFAYWPNSLTLSEAMVLGLDAPASDQCAQGRCWYANVPTLSPRTLISDDDGLTWR